MSNDLISRKALMEGRVENDPVRIAAMCALTAFDKKKVLAKLYEKYNKLVDIYNVDRKYDPYCGSKFIMNAYKDAIEIVEKGGTE